VSPVRKVQFPESLSEAESLLLRLVAEKEDIQTQLGNRNHCHPNGSRFTDEEYWVWRAGAASALRHAESQYRALKLHVKGLRSALNIGPRAVDDLIRAYRAGDAHETARLIEILNSVWELHE